MYLLTPNNVKIDYFFLKITNNLLKIYLDLTTPQTHQTNTISPMSTNAIKTLLSALYCLGNGFGQFSDYSRVEKHDPCDASVKRDPKIAEAVGDMIATDAYYVINKLQAGFNTHLECREKNGSNLHMNHLWVTVHRVRGVLDESELKRLEKPLEVLSGELGFARKTFKFAGKTVNGYEARFVFGGSTYTVTIPLSDLSSLLIEGKIVRPNCKEVEVFTTDLHLFLREQSPSCDQFKAFVKTNPEFLEKEIIRALRSSDDKNAVARYAVRCIKSLGIKLSKRFVDSCANYTEYGPYGLRILKGLSVDIKSFDDMNFSGYVEGVDFNVPEDSEESEEDEDLAASYLDTHMWHALKLFREEELNRVKKVTTHFKVGVVSGQSCLLESIKILIDAGCRSVDKELFRFLEDPRAEPLARLFENVEMNLHSSPNGFGAMHNDYMHYMAQRHKKLHKAVAFRKKNELLAEKAKLVARIEKIDSELAKFD